TSRRWRRDALQRGPSANASAELMPPHMPMQCPAPSRPSSTAATRWGIVGKPSILAWFAAGYVGRVGRRRVIEQDAARGLVEVLVLAVADRPQPRCQRDADQQHAYRDQDVETLHAWVFRR